MPIVWTAPKTKDQLLLARKEAALAYTESIIHKNRKNRKILSEGDKKLVIQFAARLMKLIPLFDSDDSLVGEKLLKCRTYCWSKRLELGDKRCLYPKHLSIVKSNVYWRISSPNGLASLFQSIIHLGMN